MTNVDEDVGKSEPLHTVAGNVNCAMHHVSTMKFLTKLNIEALQYVAVLPFASVYIQKKGVRSRHDIYAHVYCITFHNG